MPRPLCPKCGEHRYDADNYDCCYKCSMEEQGKVLCPQCQEKYYNPDQYEMCYDCFNDQDDMENDNDDDPPDPDIDIGSVFPSL